MSGNNYYRDVVNMHGGTGNTGIAHHAGAPAGPQPSAAVTQAVAELAALLRELHAQVPPATAQCIDEALPAITAEEEAAPGQRHGALMTVAGIAATAGAIGQPVLDAVRALLELLGA
ncbi:hypothetical protein ACWGF3_20240 [Streptomyces xanthophaeus]|uniref:Uncharacterized protein n=1 Tax=Streptomyces xanthophaeus TaxID=67385 RepID=A0A919H2L8_9ACTN|nr:hypothetical protein [Streptomyces xanthophaeus]GHI89518.1 hypothetical protein Sxan_68820 [Streptomyces xanthophaeus]